MARNCVYSFLGPDGNEVSLQGPAAFKAYLVNGGIEHLLPNLKLPTNVRQLRPDTALGRARPGFFGSVQEAQNYLREQFGDGIDNLVKQGTLRFTQGKEGWPEKARKMAPWAEAVYMDGQALIDINATKKERLGSVVLHEIGEHYNLAYMLGTKNYQSLIAQITARAKIKGSEAEKVWNEVKRSPAYKHLPEGSDLFVSEVIAKLGERNPKAPWYRRLIAQIKAFLVGRGLGRGFVIGTMTEADLHDLLIVSLRSAATGRTLGEVRPYQAGARASGTTAPEVIVDEDLLTVAQKDTAAAKSSHIMREDAQGVIPGRLRVLDKRLNKGLESLEAVSKDWADTRAYLRAKYGDTVTLYRVNPPKEEFNPDTVTVYFGDEKLARKFETGTQKAKAYSINVDDIVALYAQQNGYYEFIVKIPEEARFSFAGENAKTANLDTLAAAKERLQKGENPETVRKETGWHQWAPDNRWRFEIDDSKASINKENLKRSGNTVGTLLDHPDLFAAYPDLKNIPVGIVSRSMLDGANGGIAGNRIAMASNLSEKEFRSTLMHELAHLIQERENFAIGATPETISPSNYKAHQIEIIDHLQQVIDQDKAKGDLKHADKVAHQLETVMAAANFDAYQRVAGEVEARNVQERLGLSAKDRVKTPPSKTQKIKDEDTIVTFGKNVKAADKDIRFSASERFYSQLSRAIENAPDKVFTSPTQVKMWLGANAEKMGVKRDELFWSGVQDYLDTLDKGKVSREQVLSYLENNGVRVEEVTLGDAAGYSLEGFGKGPYTIKDSSGNTVATYDDAEKATSEVMRLNTSTSPKHGTLTLPGGTNYREVVLTAPAVEPWGQEDSTHFGDAGQGKQIGWIRQNDRIDSEGRKVLFLEEIQSERGRMGRKQGFGPYKVVNRQDGSSFGEWAVVGPQGEYGRYTREIDARARAEYDNKKQVPPAPFVTSADNKPTNAYIALALKTAIANAVDNGQQVISWTTGSQQADRYDLSKLVDELHWDEANSTLVGYQEGREVDRQTNATAENLDTFVGKDIAKRLIESEPDEHGLRSLYNEELKIGGGWAQAMYGDEQGLDPSGKPSLILQAARDITKKLGGRIGTTVVTSIPYRDSLVGRTADAESLIKQGKGWRAPALFITDDLRNKVLSEGMPLFSAQAVPGEQAEAASEDRSTLSEQVKRKFRDMSDKVFSEKYAFLSARQIIEMAKDYLPLIAPYEQYMQERRTAIDTWLRRSQHVLDKAKNLSRQANRDLGSAMFDSTLSDIDASRAWSGVEQVSTPQGMPYRAHSQTKFSPGNRNKLAEIAKNLGSINTTRTYADFQTEAAANAYLAELNKMDREQAEYRAKRGTKDENLKRKSKHAEVRPQFEALPEAAKTVYRETHELHTALYNEKFNALIDRVKEGVLEGSRRKQLIGLLRAQFESNALSFYYAPLFRHGPHWFYGVDANGESWFRTFENEADRNKAMGEFQARNGIDSVTGFGTSSRDMQGLERSLGGSDDFVKNVNVLIDDSSIDPKTASELQDDIYQMYLASLPQVSMRHSSQHRKNTLGFETDWQMGFAHNMHHGASQVANMVHGRRMEQVLNDNDAVLKMAAFPAKQQEAETDIRLYDELHQNWEEYAAPGAMKAMIEEAKADEDLARVQELEKMLSWVKKYGRTSAGDVEADIADRIARADESERVRLTALQTSLPSFLEWAEAGKLYTLSNEIAKARNAGQVMKANALQKLAGINAIYQSLIEKNAENSLDHAREQTQRILDASRNITLQNSSKARLVVDELRQTYNAMTNTNSTSMDRAANFVRQLGFMFHLGFSVSSAAINMLQTPGVAAPIMIGKFGTGKTWTELGKAYDEFISAMNNGWGKGKRDADGNISITTVLQDQYDAINAANPADPRLEMLRDTISAMEEFKDGGDISRTQTFDVIGVGQEGQEYGGKLLEFSKFSGVLFHHGERMNREITLKAAYSLARQNGMDHNGAVDYARWVNNRSHLDYAPENAARIFRGWPAAIALQFKKYSQGMLYNYGRLIQETFKDWTKDYKAMPEGPQKEKVKAQIKEASRSLKAMLTMQVAFAGVLGLPLEGALRVVVNMIGNAAGDDDDEPFDVERDIRTKLTEWFGETFATAVTQGVFNALTPVNVGSRMEMSDIVFREPLKEMEGRDAATNYLASLFGPTGGILQNWFEGAKLMSDGHFWRGVEKMTPKAIGDPLKAARYWSEDARTMNDMMLKDMSDTESLFQLIGFSSSELEQKYAERNYVMGAQEAIQEARSTIVQQAVEARLNGEAMPLEDIRDWNRRHPTWPIKPENIKQSLKARVRHERERGDRGYSVNPRLDYLYEKYRLTE